MSYPKDRTGFYFLLNDSTDKSQEILETFREEWGTSYREITLDILDLGTPKDKRTGSVRTQIYHALATLRNRVLEHFEKSDYEYLFSVDSDIYVRPPILGRLLSHEKDFVAALISNLPRGHCPNAMLRQGTSLLRFKVPEGDPALHEVTISGAVCLMSRKVLGSKYAWSRNGEDLPFCDSLRERGIKVYLDTAHLADHDMVG